MNSFIFNITNGITYSLKDVCKYVKKQGKYNLPYIGLEHIKSYRPEFIGSYKNKEVKSTTFHFDKGMVLYGRLRPYLRKVIMPDFEGHCSTEIFPILPNSLINASFLLYWLLSEATTKQIDSTWTGARMPRADMNKVLDFKIELPSIEKQKQIVVNLDKLQEYLKQLEVLNIKNMKVIDELKQKSNIRINYIYALGSSTDKYIADINTGDIDIFLGAYYDTKKFQRTELVFPSILNNPVTIITMPENASKISTILRIVCKNLHHQKSAVFARINGKNPGKTGVF